MAASISILHSRYFVPIQPSMPVLPPFAHNLEATSAYFTLSFLYVLVSCTHKPVDEFKCSFESVDCPALQANFGDA